MIATPVSPLLFTPRQAAQALSVCAKTLWHLEQRGQLKPIRIGKSVRYPVADLQAFIQQARGAGLIEKQPDIRQGKGGQAHD